MVARHLQRASTLKMTYTFSARVADTDTATSLARAQSRSPPPCIQYRLMYSCPCILQRQSLCTLLSACASGGRVCIRVQMSNTCPFQISNEWIDCVDADKSTTRRPTRRRSRHTNNVHLKVVFHGARINN